MEYKFRGKDVKTGEWVYGFHCVWQGIHLIFDSPFNLFHNPVEVHSDSVGMWTGLKDKSGIEIYGGDVVKANNPVEVHSTIEYIGAGYHRSTRLPMYTNPTPTDSGI